MTVVIHCYSVWEGPSSQNIYTKLDTYYIYYIISHIAYSYKALQIDLAPGRSPWTIGCLGHHRREFVCRKALWCWRFGIGRCFLWRWCRCLETFGDPSSRSSHFDRHLAGFHLCHCNAGGFLVWFSVQSCLRAHWSLGVFSDTFLSFFGCSMLFGTA